MEAIEEIWKRPSPAFRECRTVGGDSSTPWHQMLMIHCNVESLSFTMTVAMQLPATMNMMQLK